MCLEVAKLLKFFHPCPIPALKYQKNDFRHTRPENIVRLGQMYYLCSGNHGFKQHRMAKQEYIQKNREWLAAKALETGVKPLDKGIYYKPLKRGNPEGKSPNRGSVVTVHYTGKTINGKTFDSSRGGVAPAFRLRALIPGWIIALQQMHVGDKWEVYIPAEQAYGKSNQPGIPGGSTLVFEIELIGVA